jgi:hypothetical protein
MPWHDDAVPWSLHPANFASWPSDRLPAPAFAHLRTLTDRLGIWEHADRSTPRREHGFCTDDNARALVVVCRQAPWSNVPVDLATTYLGFVVQARTASGGFRNRRRADGVWTDAVGSDDSQGRAWWALGTVARLGPTAAMRQTGRDAFISTAMFESPHLRSNAYAALGAAEMITAVPGHSGATALLERASGVIAAAAADRIPWPETRLTYDNARLPEALLAAGAALGDRRLVSTGLRLLEWLVAVETNGDRFSFTPVRGWAPGEARPSFDQQPIEAAAMAEACLRAWGITGDPVWQARAIDAGRWLLGHNDIGLALYDPATGATGDGLMEDSVNENRGAESTIAGIATLQVAALCADEGSQPSAL